MIDVTASRLGLRGGIADQEIMMDRRERNFKLQRRHTMYKLPLSDSPHGYITFMLFEADSTFT
jgi:hypothetical protein